MRFLRDRVDSWYSKNRDRIFAETENDPEFAHETFVKLAQQLHRFGLERFLLNCPENNQGTFEVSNAAGFNKNGEIPPSVLFYSGMDRVVIGTVTADEWKGNPKPRIKRYPDTLSMVNWMGLPGHGADRVAETIQSYGTKHGVPITINFMATPGKNGVELLGDLDSTVTRTRDLYMVDRYELNISCPNTHGSSGQFDARKEYQDQWSGMLTVVTPSIRDQELWIKVSPDMTRDDVKDLIEVCSHHDITGFVATNTTRDHDVRYITSKPNATSAGGASGDAVWDKSRAVQKMLAEEIESSDKEYGLIACGGIRSALHAHERMNLGRDVRGIQLFTPLIYSGPKLIRDIKSYRECLDIDD